MELGNVSADFPPDKEKENPRNSEGAFLKRKDKTIAFPKKSFQSVTFFTTEKKQCRLKRIEIELLLNNSRQTINRLSHVGVTAGKENFLCHSDVP